MLETVEIPEGEFLMGCESGADNERPLHTVRLDRFAIARFPVTNRLFDLFIKETGRSMPPDWQPASDRDFNNPDQPVTSVNWFDSTHFCEWLAKATGKSYRLPTEAEWERAARGNLAHGLYILGDEPQPLDSWQCENGPEPTARATPNSIGLFGMCENVHEWCADWYDAEYYTHSPRDNPQGAASGMRRSSRGGSWRHDVRVSRVAARSSIPPDYRYSDYGFRCALSL